MPTIVPAILEETKLAFDEKVSLMTKIPGVERIHVDFSDGVFIDRVLLPVTEISPLNPAFHFEAHLMVREAGDFLDYKIAGFETVLIHYEAYDSAGAVIQSLADIKEAGLKSGIVINAATDVGVIKQFDIYTNHFQIMSVVPGKQGQVFISEMINKISALRSLLPHAIIEVDGGVNETNIKQIIDAGADLLVVGAAIAHAENMTEAYERLQGEISRN